MLSPSLVVMGKICLLLPPAQITHTSCPTPSHLQGHDVWNARLHAVRHELLFQVSYAHAIIVHARFGLTPPIPACLHTGRRSGH